jgi:membrane dipeptidase
MMMSVALPHDAIVWDNHVCLPHRAEAEWFAQLARHRAAGVTVASLNLGDAQIPLETQMRMAAFFRRQVAMHPDTYRMAETVDDILQAKQDGRLAIVFDVEGAWAMEGQIDLVPLYRQIGVRWLSIAFNRANWAGGGVHDAEDPGLTDAGRELLDALAVHGIVACCTHTGYRTAHQAIEHQRAIGNPLIFSHSNARALDDHPRNIPDDLIDAVASIDGVVGINGLSIFLGNAPDLAARFVDHVTYIAERVGAAHVGIGLDYVYDQVDMDAQLAAARGTWPAGYGYEPGIRYLEPEALPRVVDLLLGRGWSDDDLRRVLGGNFLRVAEQVWL